MYHRMTIRAYRAEVTNRAYTISLAQGRQRFQVVNVDEIRHVCAIKFTKPETTNTASCSIVCDTVTPNGWFPFVGVYRDPYNCSLRVMRRCAGFFNGRR